MPHMIDITRRFADVLELETESSATGSRKAMQSASVGGASYSTTPATVSPVKRRKTKPAPIDISLAHRNRAQQDLPYIRSPVSTPSENDPSTLYERPKGTPIYIHIYAQLRSPGSSTPFPTGTETPQNQTMPRTTIFGQLTPNTPSTATCSTSSHSIPPTPRYFPSAPPPTAIISQTETTSYISARSKRLQQMLIRHLNPIDTEVETFTISPTWYRARTPIAGRWDLFRRPSQVKLARLAEKEWYGPNSLGDEDLEEEESDGCSGCGSSGGGGEGSSCGWSGLPSPISPLFV